MARGGYSQSKVALLGVKAIAAQFADVVNERLLAEKTSGDALKDSRELRREARALLERVRRAARGGA